MDGAVLQRTERISDAVRRAAAHLDSLPEVTSGRRACHTATSFLLIAFRKVQFCCRMRGRARTC